MLVKHTPEKVLQAAISLFARHGYRGVSVRDICKKAKVSNNAVHYHFNSKENLYRSILEGFSGDVLGTAQSILTIPADSFESLSTRLRIYLEATLDVYIRQRELIRIILNEFEKNHVGSDPKLTQQLQRPYLLLSTFIDNAIHDGFLKKDVTAKWVASLLLEQLANRARYFDMPDSLFGPQIHNEEERKLWISSILNLALSGIVIAPPTARPTQWTGR